MDKFRSCGMECTKKLSCGHTCKLQCHSGPCRPVEECQSKVRVSCKCRHRKVQKFPCSSAPKQLECNESCKEYAEEQKRKKEENWIKYNHKMEHKSINRSTKLSKV